MKQAVKWQIAVYSLARGIRIRNRNYIAGQGLFGAITFLLLMLIRNLDGRYQNVSYDLQINLAHYLLVYHVCGKLDSSYNCVP